MKVGEQVSEKCRYVCSSYCTYQHHVPYAPKCVPVITPLTLLASCDVTCLGTLGQTCVPVTGGNKHVECRRNEEHLGLGLGLGLGIRMGIGLG